MRYLRVGSVEELLVSLREDRAVILSGGTDLLVKIRSGLVSPETLVDISDLESLRGILDIDGPLEIGAATPEQDLLSSQIVRDRLPLLASALEVLGSVQIRNRGTIGGNLANASPAADSAVPLLLYDADAVLRSEEGERTLPVESLLVGPGKTALRPGEFIRALRMPDPGGSFIPFFHKIGKRRALTIAIASVGALLRVEGGRVTEARLAAGSVAPVPLRLRQVEEHLRGASLTKETIDEARRIAIESVSPIDDVRASAEYRRAVVGELVARALRSSLS